MRLKHPGLEKFKTPRQFFLAVIACDRPFQSSVDCFGGDGPYFSVRRCRQLHLKGDHWNWYAHIAYQQFDSLEAAQADARRECSVYDCPRATVREIACGDNTHQVLHIYLEKDEWHCALTHPSN
jgi:hypothetical protein